MGRWAWMIWGVAVSSQESLSEEEGDWRTSQRSCGDGSRGWSDATLGSGDGGRGHRRGGQGLQKLEIRRGNDSPRERPEGAQPS